MNSYELSRAWFNFTFDNPELIKPIHTAIYFFAMEHCNRLGNKEKFGFPSQMTMDAIGVKNYQTYGKALSEIENWGFFKFIERSKNQYSANIISIVAPTKNSKARGKALDKATIKHVSKQPKSTTHGIVSIDKPLTNKPINQEPKKGIPSIEDFINYGLDKGLELNLTIDVIKLKSKYLAWETNKWRTGKDRKITNWKTTLLNTLNYLQKEDKPKVKETAAEELIRLARGNN